MGVVWDTLFAGYWALQDVLTMAHLSTSMCPSSPRGLLSQNLEASLVGKMVIRLAHIPDRRSIKHRPKKGSPLS